MKLGYVPLKNRAFHKYFLKIKPLEIVFYTILAQNNTVEYTQFGKNFLGMLLFTFCLSTKNLKAVLKGTA